MTDRSRRPALPKNFPQRTAAEQRRRKWLKATQEVDAASASAAPAIETADKVSKHRHNDQMPLLPLCVWRGPFPKPNFLGDRRYTRLEQGVSLTLRQGHWDHDGARERSDVEREAANKGQKFKRADFSASV